MLRRPTKWLRARRRRPPATTATAASKGINGKLLYSITRGPNHKIEFYELEHGETAAHESLLIGDTAELEAIDRPMKLADVYRLRRAERHGAAGARRRRRSRRRVPRQPAAGHCKADSHGSATPAPLANAAVAEKTDAIRRRLQPGRDQ